MTIAVVAAASACTMQVEGGLATPIATPVPTSVEQPPVESAVPSTPTAPPTSVLAAPTTSAPTTSSTVSTVSTEDRLRRSIFEVRPRSDLPAPELPSDWSTASIGTSVEGREITALVRPVALPRHTVLVIGGLHGNEPVSPPTVRGLVEAAIPDDVAVWLVPEANPDGSEAGTRWNDNGVDLNRNFSWWWSEIDGGPAPISEPETQALTELIETLRPTIVVWVHQPYGYVSAIGPTDPAFEQAWSTGSGTPVRSGVKQHGGGESWTAFEAGLPSMLIEIGSWDATRAITDAQRGGFEALVAALG